MAELSWKLLFRCRFAHHDVASQPLSCKMSPWVLLLYFLLFHMSPLSFCKRSYRVLASSTVTYCTGCAGRCNCPSHLSMRTHFELCHAIWPFGSFGFAGCFLQNMQLFQEEEVKQKDRNADVKCSLREVFSSIFCNSSCWESAAVSRSIIFIWIPLCGFVCIRAGTSAHNSRW